MIFKTLLYPLAKSLGLTPNLDEPEPNKVSLQKFLLKVQEIHGLGPNQKNGRHKEIMQLGRVVPDANRCVQCGVCVFNCPIGIPVRDYAHRGLPVDDPGCITCGQCIQVCPRGTLRWETQTHAFVADRFPIAIDLVDTPDGLNTPSPATGEI